MARSQETDRRYLEQKSGKWRVTVAVPRDLQGTLGTRLKRSLNTDSLAVANALKWPVIAEFKDEIAKASSTSKPKALLVEAVEIARYRSLAIDAAELAVIDEAIVLRAEEIQGPPIGFDTDEPLFDPEREQEAFRYVATARGEATPLDLHHQRYLDGSNVKPRTKGDDVRALKFLTEWCVKNGVEQTVQAITKRRAVRFMDDLPALMPGRESATLQKYLNRLSRYWQWLNRRDVVETDVWSGLKLPTKSLERGTQERPFTDAEMTKLLEGEAAQVLHDLMRIAALTGARLEAIVDLRVDGCSEGLFLFKPQKKERGERAVPIHTELFEIVSRRCAGKAGQDSLFPEWPPPKKSTSERERSFKASNAFTDYRRSVGVEEMVEGKRRSLVNFHSFRRWFITKAEQAGQPESIIAAVVGHKRQGMTLGRYSAGPSREQARACVEAVRLPEMTDTPDGNGRAKGA